MSHPYQFRLDIIKLVIEQDVGIREVAKLHHIPHSVVIHWLKAFRERGLDGVKSLYKKPQPPKIVKPKMKKKKLKCLSQPTFRPKLLKLDFSHLSQLAPFMKRVEADNGVQQACEQEGLNK